MKRCNMIELRKRGFERCWNHLFEDSLRQTTTHTYHMPEHEVREMYACSSKKFLHQTCTQEVAVSEPVRGAIESKGGTEDPTHRINPEGPADNNNIEDNKIRSNNHNNYYSSYHCLNCCYYCYHVVYHMICYPQEVCTYP